MDDETITENLASVASALLACMTLFREAQVRLDTVELVRDRHAMPGDTTWDLEQLVPIAATAFTIAGELIEVTGLLAQEVKSLREQVEELRQR